MTIGIDGMASGLDTTAIIDGLVKIQANQQVLLKNKSTVASTLVQALQGLNSRVASLATAATKVADPASWAVTKASSSSDTVTVAGSESARAGTVALEVTQLASGQVSLLDPTKLQAVFTLGTGGQTYDITPSSPNPEDVAAAINALADKTGITATRVRTGGTDSSPTYSLQLTGKTGEANSFTVHAGTDTSVPALASADNAIATAKDATIAMWPGSSGSYELSSATNTFTDVLEGVDLTVSTVSSDPVTITVTTDADAQRKLADELVANVSVVLSEIASRTRTTTETDSSGNTVVTGGLFSGDSAIRFLTNDIQAAMTNPVNGRSPAAVGITMDRYGAVTLDKVTFDKAMAEDPKATMETIQALATRVGEVAERASDKTEGSLTGKITSQESVVRDLGTQIAKWDERLSARRAQLVAQFSSMEVRLSQLNSTQSWLTNQIAGLNASKQ
ncbi:flagellar hook-associated protein 2 [Georgenia satyanarayanai]|uniref:Flagellar hook-associated protein 2 n=1 Tax=Georgenia satyanarayanai TaxID=860221 RepID=A0A2Y9A9T7_9MICO|nr:flagellar filament capping protein FliD [Georgenia satyanarayanai]PYG01080.1 flagellar hook-associated protein 2 [Georgenia satyanarayanai]SSA39319.1 flagellar hook-associated protein 2 [Georgenia satyanarayanai]